MIDKLLIVIWIIAITLIGIILIVNYILTIYNQFARKSNIELDEKLKEIETKRHLIEVHQRSGLPISDEEFIKINPQRPLFVYIFVILCFTLIISLVYILLKIAFGW